MAPSCLAKSGSEDAPRRRMIFINLHLGFMANRFTPKHSGRDYKASEYLKLIDQFRDDYTVITGTSHPGVNGALLGSLDSGVVEFFDGIETS